MFTSSLQTLGYKYFLKYLVNASLSALPFSLAILIALLNFMQYIGPLAYAFLFVSFLVRCLKAYPKQLSNKDFLKRTSFSNQGLTT